LTPPKRGQHALVTLRHRDFRLLWIGQLVSTVGDQIQVVAIAWHVYVLTGSALQLGLVGAARAIPFLLLTLFGGAAADMVDRRRLLVWVQAIQIARQTGYIGGVIVWNLNYQMVVPQTDEKWGFAVLHADFTPRPAFSALASMPKT